MHRRRGRRGLGTRAAELFDVFGTEIVQTTPVQAELAKIWTNILRYTQFALPNLLMMECEQYGANVFEVIEPDQPRLPARRHGRARADRGRLPAEGLHLLGGALERARHAARRLARARERAAVHRRGGQVAARRLAARPQGRGARAEFKRDTDDVRDSLSYKLVRMLERELAHVARHDPYVPAESEPLEAALDGADAVIVATNHTAYEGLLRRLPRPHAGVDPWNVTGSARCSPGPRARDRRVNRVLVTGGAGTIGKAVVRRLVRDRDWRCGCRPARRRRDWMRERCEVHRGDLREPEEAREATAGCSHVVHLAAIVGGIANFHKLPFTLPEVNHALYNSVFRAALEQRVERLLYVSSLDGVRERDRVPDPEEHVRECPAPRSAYGFSKLAGEVYCRALHDEHGLAYTICRPFNAYGPGEMPDSRARHRPRGAGPDPQGAVRAAAAARSSAPASRRVRSRTWTTSPTGSSRRMAHPAAAERGLQHLGVATSGPLPRSRGLMLGGVRRGPGGASSSSTCRASRWTCSGAGRPSRRRAACSAGRRGSASRTASRDTVRWLREPRGGRALMDASAR